MTSASTSPKRPVVIFPRTTPTEQPVKHIVLLVDDDDAARGVVSVTLERKGFDVVAAANVAEADEVIVKPFEAWKLAELLRDEMLTRKPAARLEKERMAATLQRCSTGVVEYWLARVRQSNALNHLLLSDEERAGHLPKLIADRLGKSSATTKDSDALSSTAAIAHGKLRFLQGYTPAVLVHESRYPGDPLRDVAEQSEPSGF